MYAYLNPREGMNLFVELCALMDLPRWIIDVNSYF